MGQRQQRGQQRHRVGLRKAIPGQDPCQFLQLGLRHIVPLKLQHALHVLDHRIQGAVLMIGRAAKLDPCRALFHNLFFQLLHQP